MHLGLKLNSPKVHVSPIWQSRREANYFLRQQVIKMAWMRTMRKLFLKKFLESQGLRKESKVSNTSSLSESLQTRLKLYKSNISTCRMNKTSCSRSCQTEGKLEFERKRSSLTFKAVGNMREKLVTLVHWYQVNSFLSSACQTVASYWASESGLLTMSF